MSSSHRFHRLRLLLAHAAFAGMTAIAAAPAAHGAAPQAVAYCKNCGTVEAVRPVRQHARTSGLGVVAGAVVGGVLGNQIGGGSGRSLATVAGAVGGGYAGNEIEKRSNAVTRYQVRVRMEDGRLRRFTYGSLPQFRAGDRVRVVRGRLAWDR